MLRILIADDHAIIRNGLRQILLQEYSFALIDEVSSAEAAIKKIVDQEWDVILCDLSMPGKSGLDVVQHVKNSGLNLPVLILSIHPEELYAIRTLEAGAAGYLSKNSAPEELITAVQMVLQGRKYVSTAIAENLGSSFNNEHFKLPHEILSQQEFSVFKLIAEGKPLTEIAHSLSIEVTEVITCRTRLLIKMNLKSNAELNCYGMKHKLI